jgi:hypothetical protein
VKQRVFCTGRIDHALLACKARLWVQNMPSISLGARISHNQHGCQDTFQVNNMSRPFMDLTRLPGQYHRAAVVERVQRSVCHESLSTARTPHM